MKDELDKAWAEYVPARRAELATYELRLDILSITITPREALRGDYYARSLRKLAAAVQAVLSPDTTIQFIPGEGCLVAGVMMFLYQKSA